MNITCENCRQELENELSALPTEWKNQIIDFVCDSIVQNTSDYNCDTIKACQTVTSLSDFRVTGTRVCITFIDENEVEVERCFDFKDVFNNFFDGVDPKCVASPTAWDNMTPVAKFQAIIDKVCDTCVDAVTSTTTFSEPPLPTTTTTTTQVISEPPLPTTTTTTTTICPNIMGMDGVGGTVCPGVTDIGAVGSSGNP